VETDDQNLREKARLLLSRERELFDLRARHELLGTWLSLGQALPPLFLDRGASLQQICDRVRKTLASKLRLQRVLLLELQSEALRPLAPAGPERALSAEARALFDTQPCGLCNDAEAELEHPGIASLARTLGLHRFMWSRIARAGSSPILLAVGFDRAKAGFQSPFGESDRAHFGNAAQHIESLLANALLVGELEREKDQLRQANLTLEHRDRELQKAAEQLLAANETLEQRVRDRTQELAGKNRDLRLVLDNVDQALLTVDLEGRLAPERSNIFDRWFGPYDGRPRFVEHVGANFLFAEHFDLGLEALRDALLPPEVCLSQMPRRFAAQERQFECRYLPIGDEDLVGVLLVIDDVTERLARAREEAEQRELLAAFTALMKDRNGFLTFSEESERMLRDLSGAGGDRTLQKRLLHTLKGNAATFGMQLIADHCHRAESELEENLRLEDSTIEQLRARWEAIVQALRAVLPSKRRTIEISETELESLADEARRGASAAQIIAELERLRWEPVERPLGRLAQHAQALATRLGKATPEIRIEADAVRLDPDRWAPLWSALVHVLRNALDHGIESAERRIEIGKPAAGRLRLAARRETAGFTLEIEDDGQGIDWDAVRRLCQTRGRPSATRTDLVDAILSPEFSTRKEVTETSGRGIGLTAVFAVVRELGGRLAVHSDPHAGTRWTLTFADLCLAAPALSASNASALDHA
jgi:two-component system chemotaxis sensor kinase CheA